MRQSYNYNRPASRLQKARARCDYHSMLFASIVQHPWQPPLRQGGRGKEKREEEGEEEKEEQRATASAAVGHLRKELVGPLHNNVVKHAFVPRQISQYFPMPLRNNTLAAAPIGMNFAESHYIVKLREP